MKLTLIRPQMTMAVNEIRPQSCPPLGLAYLASYMREAGHRVVVIDAVGEALTTFTRIPGYPELKLLGLPIPEIISRIPRDSEMIGKIDDLCFAVMPVLGLEAAIFCRRDQKIGCKAIGFIFLLALASLAINEDLAFSVFQDVSGFVEEREP